jgi:hypothetical protein
MVKRMVSVISVNARLVFFSKVLHRAKHWLNGEFAQGTQALALYLQRNVIERDQFSASCLTRSDLVEYFEHPVGALPARCALAAGLVFEESHHLVRGLKDVHSIVQHDYRR